MSKRKAKVLPFFDRSALKPKNKKQAEYINAVDNFSVVASTGVAGCGKTYIASIMAADMLDDGRSPIEKIIIARPAEGNAKSIGLLPGSATEKLEGWVAPVAEAIKSRIGRDHYQNYLELGKIEYMPLEQVRGRTFNNAFVIVDEAQNMDTHTIKCLLTRIGMDCKLIINGDIAQRDLKGSDCGLKFLIKMFETYENPPAKIVDFDSWDYCVRSPESRYFGQVIEEMEREGIA